MRRALGIATGLALIAAALSPLPTAQASCLSATGEYQDRPLIGIEVAARATPPAPSGRVSYTRERFRNHRFATAVTTTPDS